MADTTNYTLLLEHYSLYRISILGYKSTLFLRTKAYVGTRPYCLTAPIGTRTYVGTKAYAGTTLLGTYSNIETRRDAAGSCTQNERGFVT